MRIVILSDTHYNHNSLDMTRYEGDLLIFAGDSECLIESFTKDFVYWLMGIKGFDCKIFIAGNHDFIFEHNRQKEIWFQHLMNTENLSQSDCVYLEDSGVEITFPEFSRPIKIYGSPWQPWFGGWAFNLPRDGEEIKLKWEKIPTDTDILITHGPPFGIKDTVMINGAPTNQGCKILREKVEEISPIIHCFGHIHDDRGIIKIKDTTYVNASLLGKKGGYITYPPIVIELEEVDGKILVTKCYD